MIRLRIVTLVNSKKEYENELIIYIVRLDNLIIT